MTSTQGEGPCSTRGRKPEKGDYISYGGHGVCLISDIRAMDFGTGSGEQEYYVIEPIAAGNATIYLPRGNPKVLSRMRPVSARSKEGRHRIIQDRQNSNRIFTQIDEL